MNSILRKAMWPAALIVGMFVLIGAFGHATAPTAFAAPGDVCDIQGPFSSDAGGTGELTSLENDLLIEGNEYLFIVRVEGAALGVAGGELGDSTIDVSIDDETGDGDFTSFANSDAGGTPASMVVVPGTDSINQIDNFELLTWDPDLIDELEADFDLDISALTPCVADADAVTAGAQPSIDGLTFVTVECDRSGTWEMTAFEDGATDNVITEEYTCVGAPDTIVLTAYPLIVESVPALGNISHSLIVARLTDDGNFVAEGYEVDWSTNLCRIDGLSEADFESVADDLFNAFTGATTPSNAAAIELEYDGHGGVTASDTSLSFLDNPAIGGLPFGSYAAAILHCEGAVPGVATVNAEVEDDQVVGNIVFGPTNDLDASIDITVVGPPAFISMTAAPEELVCGEKATILVIVTDAINQNVSDHTRIELITNYGGVIGGTGSSLGFPGVNPVNPLSSSAAETFGGVATAYLLTSTNHIGPYEVVAAAGGSNLGSYSVFGGTTLINEETVDLFYSGGNQFSTPVVTSQVTVTCSEGEEPDVTAPDTGTGTISPPNTGDAGLAASSAGYATLAVIAGAVAFVLAGFAKLGFARRS